MKADIYEDRSQRRSRPWSISKQSTHWLGRHRDNRLLKRQRHLLKKNCLKSETPATDVAAGQLQLQPVGRGRTRWSSKDLVDRLVLLHFPCCYPIVQLDVRPVPENSIIHQRCRQPVNDWDQQFGENKITFILFTSWESLLLRRTTSTGQVKSEREKQKATNETSCTTHNKRHSGLLH